ncbi:MAG: L,D-transpeptidase family protein [Anaerolineae bacterium]|jgi:lipoprotein-anchoring transpeptidase ErfK/SrfK|nr:L,D-transpeptidase family protein [Anaerolineae bacterium]
MQKTVPNRNIQSSEATVPSHPISDKTVAHVPMQPKVQSAPPPVVNAPMRQPIPMPPPQRVMQPRPISRPAPKKRTNWWLWGFIGFGILGISSTIAVIFAVFIIQADKNRLDMSKYLAPKDVPSALTTITTQARQFIDVSRILVLNPLSVRLYDPVTGDFATWELPIANWDSWLSATPDASVPNGYRFDIEAQGVTDFLMTQQSRHLDASRFINMAEALDQIQVAVQNNAQATLRVYHNPRQHVVGAGETITSIAWDYGIPYLYIQQANNGISSLSVGQTITIPPADMFIELAPNPNKRIEVSIPEQRVRVYENGVLLWDWGASTGINSSPTWRGVYQILSHEINAYAGNWNLWMPNFMGVYRPVPNADFTNGFHGFPTRGGGQLLWENSIGTRVTYGCILLSNTHIQQLYTWAEEGVVVEIN